VRSTSDTSFENASVDSPWNDRDQSVFSSATSKLSFRPLSRMLWVSEAGVEVEDGEGENADAGNSSPSWKRRIAVKRRGRNAISWLGRARTRTMRGLRAAYDIVCEGCGGVAVGEGGAMVVGEGRRLVVKQSSARN